MLTFESGITSTKKQAFCTEHFGITADMNFLQRLRVNFVNFCIIVVETT
ncbi:MAG: hypothetical protein K0R59_606 [Sphingobacterium sp.]|jgi:hypothetical protein|nr:hypothetical protein [Sphingobacterium sp.]